MFSPARRGATPRVSAHELTAFSAHLQTSGARRSALGASRAVAPWWRSLSTPRPGALCALALALCLPLGSNAGAAANAADGRYPLTVRVSQLKNDRGRVAVALFTSASDFPDQKRALRGQLAKIQGGRAAVTFKDLPPGVYAVAVLHDENENDEMDFNFLGMPLEGYGFSNDASAPFGPPSFEAAAFRLSPRASFIPVKARYFF